MPAKETRPAAEARWRDLTWDDLESWAGARSLERGRSYQRSGRVKKLARSAEGALVAWVQGQMRYATRVELKPGAEGGEALESRCSCPVGADGCKHAVAVVVEYLEALKKGKDAPIAPGTDPRWRLAEEEGPSGDGEDWADEEDDEGQDEEERTIPTRARPASRPRRGGAPTEDLRGYLEGLPVAELASYILDLAERDPDLTRDLLTRSALAHGATGTLIRQARKEITRLTAQEVWHNHWSGEGSLPDYSRLQALLEQLLAHGQADALLELGDHLFARGREQIGSARDEGETAGEIIRCLDVVFRAVQASTRSDVDKLLYVLDKVLVDDYDICQGAGEVLARDWPAAVWSAVADNLEARLRADKDIPSTDDFSARYSRDRLSGWLIKSLRRAGLDAEVLPILEAEARITGSYERLVRELIEAGRLDDARRWALEGIEKVGSQWPGVANHLREHLRELAKREKDWPAVAAFQAEEFFERPSVHTLETLQQAADRAGCGPEVRAAALHFLETGVRPVAAAPAPVTKTPARRPGKKQASAPKSPQGPPWPLPDAPPELRRPKSSAAFYRAGPHFDVLLDLALAQKRPDDVLHWYDRQIQSRQSTYRDGADLDAHVADAVAETHPDRALKTYQNIIERDIALTNPSAYKAALPYLHKVKKLLERLDRGAEWTRYLAGLRDKNRRKRRLMEVLDRIENRRILDG